MTSSPGSVMANRAFRKAMFPPAVTMISRPASGIPFSSTSFLAMRSRSGSSPQTGVYLWCSGSLPKALARARASGGGPKKDTPWPKDSVPGLSRMSSRTTGMTGSWIACIRWLARMGSASPAKPARSGARPRTRVAHAGPRTQAGATHHVLEPCLGQKKRS